MQYGDHHDRRTDTDRPTREDDHTRDHAQRDASGSWREEYDLAGVPIPDGGRDRRGWVLPDPGARVHDLDGDGSDELLVVDTHPTTTAEAYHLEALGGRTVADVNPEYAPGAPVVEAVYLDDTRAPLDGDGDILEDVEDDEAALEAVRQAIDAGAITAYSFPADRLSRRTAESAGGETA
jgi:hypothetical protein